MLGGSCSDKSKKVIGAVRESKKSTRFPIGSRACKLAYREQGKFRRLSSGPQDFDGVCFNNAVGGYKNHLFERSLRYEQPIERIAVMRWEVEDRQSVRVGDR